MATYKYVGKRGPRLDAGDKVTGRTQFATDRYFPEMLYAKVLRSPFAHARINRIDVEKARRQAGVVTVLTHEDIAGHNGFGAIVPNLPVPCRERVRYQGGAVCVVL